MLRTLYSNAITFKHRCKPARNTFSATAPASPQASTMAPSVKVIYFELPGRAETTRCILAQGGIPFENSTCTRETWPELKPKMPFGQLPVMEVDGKMLAQSSAIERYAGALAGLVPSDPWLAAKGDELCAFLTEIGELFRPTYAIADPAEKIKARQDLVAGPVKVKLEKLQSLLEAGGGEYFVGGSLSWADITVYCTLSNLISGFLDGIPKDLHDSYPLLKAHHNRIAALPAIAARYEKETEGLRVAFKALA